METPRLFGGVQRVAYYWRSQTEVASPPAMVVVLTSENTHARMDRLEQRMGQLRLSDGGMALYSIKKGIAKGLWSNSSPSDSKGNKPAIGQRPGDVSAISASRPRPLDIIRQLDRLPEFIIRHHPMCTPRPPPQPLPPQFRMDLHCTYHQGLGHDTDCCSALRHAIQDLIDQGLVNLGQPSVTTNSLPAHTTHSLPLPTSGIHHMDFVQDDVIHMLSWDDGLPEMIVPDDDYEIVGATLDSLIPSPLSLILDRVSRRIAQAAPPITRPFGGIDSREKVRREDDEILRQLQSTYARISIWSLLAASSTHRNALIRALSQIRVETSTTPNGLIHMMTTNRATCIVPQSLIRLVGQWLCPKCLSISHYRNPQLCTFRFGPSTQIVRAYDNTQREVIGRRQHGFSEFVTTVDYDTPFSLGLVLTKADYRYMAFCARKIQRSIVSHAI
ncbi:hypothetical protein CK203_061506 [Vitis vinifera]|uniref:Uncharacterized protein n=1 Tax=Vitis vinifera TaxID=29760 RepID=A0A438GTD0_VITVI|nr:hypothetical protein CK203_061506 [Vitis vinifera]